MYYDCCPGALLDIRNLQIRFGTVEAVRGISLQIHEGEMLGLVGESGSGKSATARLRTAPEHACTRSLLAAVPTLRTDRTRPLALVGHSTASATALYSPHAG